MDFIAHLTGQEPKKDKNKKKKYTEKAKLNCFVNGFDDITGRTFGQLRNIEAGSWLHGLLVVKTPILPQDPTALTKFVLQGRYRLRIVHTTHHTRVDKEGHRHEYTETHHKTKNEKWLKAKFKVALRPMEGVDIFQDTDGLYVLQYPFSYHLSPDLCDSFSQSGSMCKYDLKVKMKFPCKTVKVKSVHRDVDIMARRPTPEELIRKQPAQVDKHKSMFGMMGQVDVACHVDGFCFLEGTQVLFTADIDNKMEKPIMKGYVELEEHIRYTVLHTSDRGQRHYTTSESSRDVVHVKLMALEILGKSRRRVKFALDLPHIVEPPTTGFHSGHHCTDVRHYLKLHLDVPWGKDIRISFPVRIVVNPSRYHVPSFYAVLEGTMPVEAEGLPNGYAPLPKENVITPMIQYPVRPSIVLRLVCGKGLPKMDFTFGGLRGPADPFCTIFINDNVRTSRVIDDTVNPVWNQDFFVFLDEPSDFPIRFYVTCYDYDRTSKSDPIGNAKFMFDPNYDLSKIGQDIDVCLSLQHPKKGLLENRGILTFQIIQCVLPGQ